MSEEPGNAIHPIVAGHELPPDVGGKALGLALIARAGLHVPHAWAVLPGAALSDLAALAAAVEARGLRSLAVRSSAADEDGARASFAGVHETALGIPPGRLAETIAAVAASAFSDRAVAYRRQLGLPPARGGCAVVVQEMVDAEAAGVAFGRGTDEVVIESVEGLGEIAVNGEAIPETLVLRRGGDAWTVLRRQRRRQRVALRHAEGGPIRVALEEARQRTEVLTLPIATAIAAGVRALETTTGGALDVEWAVCGGRVAFLQARPQTTPLSAALPASQIWTRANLREVLPDLPSAFTRSFLVPALERGERIALVGQGLRMDPTVPLAATVHGRMIFNERVFFELADAFGMPESFRAWIRCLVGGNGVSSEIPGFELGLALRHPVLVARSLVWSGGALRNAHRYLARLREHRATRGTDRSDVALLASVRGSVPIAEPDRWVPAVVRIVAVIADRHMAAGAILRRLDAAAVLPRLLAASEVSVSTRQIEDLVALALQLREWDGAAQYLSAAPREAARWRAELPTAAWEMVERWIAAYGHRGPYETDLSWPRYRDDLRLLARALQPMVASSEPPETVEERRLRRRRDSEAVWAEVSRAVGPLQRARLRGILRTLAQAMALREQLRSDLMVVYADLRDDIRELGRRFAVRGRLDGMDDVFHLELSDLERAVADPGYDVRAVVRRELARRAAWRRIEVPNRFTSEEIGGMAERDLSAAEGAGAMRGTAVSPGQAEAPVCVLRSPDEGERMPTGAVLVAPATDPGWTLLFARASAVVVEIGGLFSHAATVAREYGLPAVSNIERATDLLRDGDVVRVDGSRGVVEVVSRAPRP